ncbi:UDP-N-acetylglucosamine 2-epimerase [Candidatus Margulisiibacteriota bacterium]
MGANIKKKICFITGTRADYGILCPVMKAVQSCPQLSLYVIATAMHLMKDFGYTVREIEADGFKIYDKVNISYQKDTGEAMAISVGSAITKFSKSFKKLKPDLIVLLGDRGEMLAAAIAANYLNIPVAHIHGGEISGHIDGMLRHAITKLSHLHFPASRGSRRRLLRLGEAPKMVFVAGAPALDRILNEQLPAEEMLRKKYKLKKDGQFVLLVQHPVSYESRLAGRQLQITLQALIGLGLRVIVIYPNADAGGRQMIKVIRQYQQSSKITAHRNVPHKDYLGLMKIAGALVGNSSSGIIEAPSLGLPVINIGRRQAGRERGLNVIDVPHDQKQIARALIQALYNKNFIRRIKRAKNPYGSGQAAQHIAKVLSSISLGENLLQKQITY